jgi:23S rRNA (pseudouridine1915-N3)-methyltransferase
MRLTIVAVGRAKAGPELELYRQFARRLNWPLALKEVEDRKKDPARRTEREAELLLAAVPAGAKLVALDERGESLTSEAFAALLVRWRDDGIGEVAFVLGGADGLSPEVLKRADRRIAFGTMTWPHQMARAMLAEQLYRAETIFAGHPYHRGAAPRTS